MLLKTVTKAVAALFLWVVVAIIVILIDPEMLKNVWLEGLYAPFFVAVLIASWYTMSLITGSVLIGFVNGLLLVLGMILQLLKVFNLISAAALGGAIIFLSYFAIKGSGKDTLIQQTKVDKL